MKIRPRYNPDLTFIKNKWDGNPLDKAGKYCNLNTPSEKSYRDLLSWQIKANPYKSQKKKQKTNVTVVHNSDFINARQDLITWLGHASFYIKCKGISMLIDPVFFNLGPLKRHVALPCEIGHFDEIDLILISHNHRDHLDQNTLTTLCKLNPRAVIYTGLGIASLLKKWKITNTIIEAAWYQAYPTFEEISITYLPAKHWNRRGLNDLNEMLWGSFMIAYQDKKIYFAADSGIDTHFEEIGSMYPDIDIAMIGIGAYEPNWFMQPSHTNPEEALQAQQMLNAAAMIPMHYGTYDLSDEPIYLPKEHLLSIATTTQRQKMKLPNVGEILLL